jgi:hypothetical protein
VTDPDAELLRLEAALSIARERLLRVTLRFSDPAVLKAAQDLYSEALAAVAAYTARVTVSLSEKRP